MRNLEHHAVIAKSGQIVDMLEMLCMVKLKQGWQGVRKVVVNCKQSKLKIGVQGHVLGYFSPTPFSLPEKRLFSWRGF